MRYLLTAARRGGPCSILFTPHKSFAVIVLAAVAAVFAMAAPTLARAQAVETVNSVTGERYLATADVDPFVSVVEAAVTNDCERLRAQMPRAVATGNTFDMVLLEDWGYRCGAPVAAHQTPAHRLTGMAITADGGIMVAGTDDGRVAIFDVANNKLVRVWETGMAKVDAIDLSINGSYLAVAGERKVVVREMRNGRLVYENEFGHYVGKLLFSPDENLLAVGLNSRETKDTVKAPLMTGEIVVVELAGGLTRAELESVPGNPVEMAFTPDMGSLVAYCWPEKYTFTTMTWLVKWDLGSGERVMTREIRTSPMLPARLSADAGVLVYLKLDKNEIERHKGKLDMDGRPLEASDLSSSVWFRAMHNYQAVAQKIEANVELPLVSGYLPVAVDPRGKKALLKTMDGRFKIEEIGTGRAFTVNYDDIDQDKPPKAAFSLNGILTIGENSSETYRYGWFEEEIQGRGALTETTIGGEYYTGRK